MRRPRFQVDNQGLRFTNGYILNFADHTKGLTVFVHGPVVIGWKRIGLKVSLHNYELVDVVRPSILDVESDNARIDGI